jgi:apolipoprotein N-acyltransferase
VKTKGAAGAALDCRVNRWRKALRVWPWLAAITSGLLCAGCFAPFEQAWLCWIALAPLIAAIWFSGENARRRWLRHLLLGYVAGLAFFWTVFSWLITVTVLGWFTLQFYMAIYFALWAWVVGLLRPRDVAIAEQTSDKWSEMLERAGKSVRRPPTAPWLRSTTNLRLAFLVAAAWTSIEWLRGWLFSGWTWNDLGVALHANWLIIQIAEFTGVAGLSFVVVFGNVIAVTTTRRLILEARLHRMRPHYDLTFTMSVIVGLLTFGWHVAQTKQPSKPLRVAMVQANIPREEKFDPQYSRLIYDKYARLSEIALHSSPPPELVIWPESAMPGPVLLEGESNRFVMDFVASTKADLLLGTVHVEEDRAYNAALLISDGGERIQIYRKVHLVPFGEFVPGRHWVPLLERIVGDQVPGDFDVGTEYTIFRLTNRDEQIAPLICFEDTIGDLTRKFVLGGANLLTNVTNDGWFRHSAGSQQHLANSIFRCVETRRPMVRAANTGVTCFVNEFGRITQVLQDDTGSSFTEGVLTGTVDVPIERSFTFYVRHGELFAQLCTCVTLIAIMVCLVRRRRRATSAGEKIDSG